MTNKNLMNEQRTESTVKSNQQRRSIEQAQESIYRFLLNIVNKWPPADVLQEFKRLFIHQNDSDDSDSIQAIYEIIIADDEETFRYTIKRCCYILVNNWKTKRHQNCIPKLIELFANPVINRQSASPTINCLRIWVQNFVNSNDYQELKLFASKYQEQDHLSNRYPSHLLVAQSADIKNPVEQREAARDRAKQLQYRFKFDLAMYMARSQSAFAGKQSNNPTGLRDEVLQIIKTIVAKQEPSSYGKNAARFIKQNKQQNYKIFKERLLKYLLYSTLDEREDIDTLRLKLSKQLLPLYEQCDEQNLSDALLQKTCTRIIEYLTTENQREPSPGFVLLMSQGNTLTLVFVLLKIILVCRPVRTYLESCIANLIRYYENGSEKESKGMINFLEFYNIIFAIYVDNVSVQLD